MKIAIFGIGSIGGYIAGRLTKAGEEVSLISRGETLNAIRNSGLTIHNEEANYTVNPKHITDIPKEIGIVDAIIICVKADAVQIASEMIKPLVGENTIILQTQNGLTASQTIGQILGQEKVLEGICNFGAQVINPGIVRGMANNPMLTIAETNNKKTERLLLLQSTLKNAGFNAVIPESFQVAQWSKLMAVSALGSIGAITRSNSPIWRQIPSVVEMWIKNMEETRDVAKSLNIDVPYKDIQDRIDNLHQGVGSTSMHRDIADGKPSEIEHQIGSIVRIAKENNVSIPVNTFIYNALLPLEKLARGEISG
jgi:2-dehydropantoate 2-reductase